MTTVFRRSRRRQVPFDVGRSGNKRDIVQVDDLTCGQNPALKGVGVVFANLEAEFEFRLVIAIVPLAEQVVIGRMFTYPSGFGD